MEKARRERGITLVALVITIIIMLILLIIVLYSAFGENGIVKMAKRAADDWKIAQQDEIDLLENMFLSEKEEDEILISVDIEEEYPDVVQWIPIYTKEQLKKVGSGEIVIIEEEGNQEYTFTKDGAYILKNDIDLGGDNWIPLTPINSIFDGRENVFSGIFFGNNKAIKNMTITQVEGSYRSLGLFGCTIGTIANLALENININLEELSDNYYIGGIVGTVGSMSYLPEAQKLFAIKNCYVTGKIEIENANASFIGGIMGDYGGYSPEGPVNLILSNLLNLTKINGNDAHLGGIVGVLRNGNTKIEKCYNKGDLDNRPNGQYLGGIVGETQVMAVNVEDCYNTGNLNGGMFNGGVIGFWYR